MGLGNIRVSTGVNVMGKRVSFGFYTLRNCSRVNLIIIRTICYSSCHCLLPMVSIRPTGSGFSRFSMMSFAVFLILYSVLIFFTA